MEYNTSRRKEAADAEGLAAGTALWQPKGSAAQGAGGRPLGALGRLPGARAAGPVAAAPLDLAAVRASLMRTALKPD